MELSIPDSVQVVWSETLRLMISVTDNQRLRTIVVGSLARPPPILSVSPSSARSGILKDSCR